MKDQLKKRLMDLAFLALAMLLGLGGFYVYNAVRNHNALDAALLEVIQQSQQHQGKVNEAEGRLLRQKLDEAEVKE